MRYTVELEQEEDGRWIAEIPELPVTTVYGNNREQAISRVEALAFRVITDRLEHGEMVGEFLTVQFEAAGRGLASGSRDARQRQEHRSWCGAIE